MFACSRPVGSDLRRSLGEISHRASDVLNTKVPIDGLGNARLIAAAPELAEALRAMLERYSDDERLDSPLDEAARAALAKAGVTS